MAKPSDSLAVDDDGVTALELARQWGQAGAAAIGSVPIDEHGTSVQVIGSRPGIAALSQHAAELQRMNRLYLTLSRVNHLITRVRSQDALLEGVCQAAVGFGRLKLAWAGWLDAATARVVPVARCGEQSDYLDQISVYADDRPLGRGPTGRAVRQGTTQVCNDFANAAETSPWRQAGRAAGFGASAAFPIRVAGQVTGALTVYAAEAGFFQDKEIRLFEEIASDVSFALESLVHDEQRRQSEARVREQAEEIRQYFDSALDLLCIGDTEGRLRRLNPEWERTLGYPLAELTGRQYLDFVHPEDLAATRAALLELTPGRAVEGFVNRYRHRDGTYRWIEWRALLRNGVVYAAARDISEQRRLQAEVETQRLRAAQADRLQALGEMATSIAHEVNQPLNGIRAFAEGALLAPAMGSQLSAEETTQAFRDIVAQVDRITQIVDHVRGFARSDESQDAVVFTVDEPVAGALKLMGAQLRVHGIALKLEFAPGLPPCRGWPNAIEQVVLNLLGNSRDALDDRMQRQKTGDRAVPPDWRPRIGIEGVDAGDYVHLVVTDNGGGMDAAVAPRAFEPFYTTKPVGKGTGIGLAIARAICARHHGMIELNNRPGEGVTFVVMLPAAEPSAARAG